MPHDKTLKALRTEIEVASKDGLVELTKLWPILREIVIVARRGVASEKIDLSYYVDRAMEKKHGSRS